MPALAAPACSHSLGARLLRYAGHCSCRAKGPAKGCRTGAQPLFPVAPLFCHLRSLQRRGVDVRGVLERRELEEMARAQMGGH